jgi:hypothetical protein
MSEPVEITEEQKKASVSIKKFYEVEPDATLVLFKLAKFAIAKPKEYAYLKKMLDKEIIKLKK